MSINSSDMISIEFYNIKIFIMLCIIKWNLSVIIQIRILRSKTGMQCSKVISLFHRFRMLEWWSVSNMYEKLVVFLDYFLTFQTWLWSWMFGSSRWPLNHCWTSKILITLKSLIIGYIFWTNYYEFPDLLKTQHILWQFQV